MEGNQRARLVDRRGIAPLTLGALGDMQCIGSVERLLSALSNFRFGSLCARRPTVAERPGPVIAAPYDIHHQNSVDSVMGKA